MITRSSITMEMLNADITCLKFTMPFIPIKFTLVCATSPFLQSKQLVLGSKIKNKNDVDLILIGEAESGICLYDPALCELRLFTRIGLKFAENNTYETASLETLKDIFFSTSDYVDVLRVRNESPYLLKDDVYAVKIPALDNQLGAGTYSEVYAGFFKEKPIAIKVSKPTKK